MNSLPVAGVQRPEGDPPVLSAKPDWKVAFSRAKQKFSADQCTDLAAALTYYSVQAMFPAIIAGVSLLGLFGNGKETTNKVVETIAGIAGKKPSDLTTISNFINTLQTGGGAGTAFVLGILMALWSASGYVGAFSRMQNRIYDVAEGRPVFKLRPWLYLITIIQVVLLVIAAMALVLSGPVAKQIGGLLGLGDQTVMLWDIVKWPFIVVIVMLIIGMMFWATPNVKRPFKQGIFNPGAMLAFVIWALGSALFAWYVSSMGNYNKTYGPMATPIVLLLWLWITNLAMLFGAEFDAEVLRTRQLKSGYPAEELVLLPVRDDKQIAKKQEKYDEAVDEARELRESSGVSQREVDDMTPIAPAKQSDERAAADLETSPETSPNSPSTKTVELDKKGEEARGGVVDADTSDLRDGETAESKGGRGNAAGRQPDGSHEVRHIADSPERERVEESRVQRRAAALAVAERRRDAQERREAEKKREIEQAKKQAAKDLKSKLPEADDRPVQEQWAEVDATRDRYAHEDTREYRAVMAEREYRRKKWFEKR